MKYTNLQAFEKHLADAGPNHFAEIYLITAKDPFERKQATDLLTTKLLAKNPSPELALKTFDASKCEVGDILQELSSLSFFADQRVIVVQYGHKLNANSLKSLVSYLQHPAKAIQLVIAAETMTKTTKFYKTWEKVGVILELVEEKAWAKEKTLTAQIMAKLQKQGKSIDPQACQLLLQQIGPQAGLIHQEIEKLLCYIDDRDQIKVQDVAKLCGSVNVEDGWKLGDAIFNGDAGRSLQISKGILDSGVSLIGLLRQVRQQLQTKFQICSILASGGHPGDVSTLFPYMRGRILDNNIQQARRYGMARFRRSILALDATELASKSSATSHDTLLERLLVKLTT